MTGVFLTTGSFNCQLGTCNTKNSSIPGQGPKPGLALTCANTSLQCIIISTATGVSDTLAVSFLHLSLRSSDSGSAKLMPKSVHLSAFKAPSPRWKLYGTLWTFHLLNCCNFTEHILHCNLAEHPFHCSPGLRFTDTHISLLNIRNIAT